VAASVPNEFPPWNWRAFLRVPRPPSASFVGAWIRRPWRIDPLAVVSSIVADGDIDLALHGQHNASALGDAWPDAPLWLCAVDQRDQYRVVFGRDRFASLTAAVTASCSVPGYFSPVMVDGQRFVDGGVHSPTNADVLRRSGLQLVIVVSPMSGRALGRVGLEAAIRRRRKLRHEIAMLRARGSRTFVLEPGHEVRSLAGMDFMSDETVTQIVGAAFLDAGEQLRSRAAQALASSVRKPGRRGELAG
jgi:NTE family protein